MFYNILQTLIITSFLLYSLVYVLRCFFPKRAEKWINHKWIIANMGSATSPCGRVTQCSACSGCGLAKNLTTQRPQAHKFR